MKKPPSRVRFLAPLLALGLASQAHAASLLVNVNATDLGGTYRYDFTLSNTGSTNIVFVDIGGTAVGEQLIADSLTTPAEFVGSYDSGLGKVSFLEGSSTFSAGNSFNGFSFETAMAPGAAFSSIGALDEFGGTVSVTVIPEAGVSLLGLASLAAFAAKRRR